MDKHSKVIFAYLFGGVARNRVSLLSDVDIAIYRADGADIVQEKLEVLGNLNELLKTDEVDLVILRYRNFKVIGRSHLPLATGAFVRCRTPSIAVGRRLSGYRGGFHLVPTLCVGMRRYDALRQIPIEIWNMQRGVLFRSGRGQACPALCGQMSW